MSNWFNVDKKGLAALMKGRSKAFILYELIQNAWDQDVSKVKVIVEGISNRAAVRIIVEDDDPEGFTDLSHAYTLFASSEKKANAEKRGRFNLGEKLVLALATEARIMTTKGAIFFDHTGRHTLRGKRSEGSEIRVEIPMTRAELDEVLDAAKRLIPPVGVTTTINGEELVQREFVTSFIETLPTLIADKEGVMCRTERQTAIRVCEPLPGETATLYEMGIPVVETGDRFHVDVGQKVPLNMDRDNVTPSYLRAIRVAVLNHTDTLISKEDTAATWVSEAISDKRVENAAVRTVFKKRFGENAVAYDPSDPEANKISTAEGRTVVHGGSLTGEQWENVRRAGALPPAGQVTPSPRPFHPDGNPLNPIPLDEWTPGMLRMREFIVNTHYSLFGCTKYVCIVNEPGWKFNATYGTIGFVLNIGCLGQDFFEEGITERVIDLVIHEFGHRYESDHLSRRYNDALTKIGAQMTRLALDKPELFR